jgi:hypothetical protein
MIYSANAACTLFENLFHTDLTDYHRGIFVLWVIVTCCYAWRAYTGFRRDMDFFYDDSKW